MGQLNGRTSQLSSEAPGDIVYVKYIYSYRNIDPASRPNTNSNSIDWDFSNAPTMCCKRRRAELQKNGPTTKQSNES